MRLKVALAVSAALNLFVVGAVVGAVLMSAKAQYEGTQPRGQTVWSAADRLPDPARSSLRQMLQQQFDAARPVIRQAHADRLLASGLIASDNFDAAAVATRLASARAAEARVRDQLDAAVLAYVAGLPADQRAKLAGPVAASRVGRGENRRR